MLVSRDHANSLMKSDYEALAEDELIRKVRQGDHAAFETLFRTYAPACLRFASSLIDDVEIGEDVVQDVFGWVWLHRSQWSPGNDILSYLLTATRNRALNALRAKKLRGKSSTDHTALGISPAMSSPQANADISLEAKEQRMHVRQVVSELRDQQRAILLLRWQNGFSWAEIGGILGLSVDAVKQQHSRLIAALRGRLTDLFE